jgi:predicted oxidoreductase
MSEQTTDIVIIGAGVAGLVAAYECLERDRSVTIVDRHSAENVGGLARTAFGGMALVGTPLQSRMGIKDTPELALRDWRSFAEFSDADVWPKQWAEAYVEQSAERVFHWLRGKGLRFMPAVNWVERGNFVPGNSVPRYHILWGTGLGLVERFANLLSTHKNHKKLQYVFGCRVDDLTVADGRVAGCRGVIEATGEEREFLGNHTMVATGGINGNLKKVREHWADAPTELLNGSHPYCNGAMHGVVAQKGGVVTHLENMWNYAAGIPHPFPQFEDHGLSLIPCKSALWLDHAGIRIGPEPLVTGFDTNDMCRRLAAMPRPWSWQLLNWRIAAREFAISGAEHNPHIRDSKMLSFLKEVLLGNHRLVRQMQDESDHFIVSDTLPELVEQMNALNGDNLVQLENVAQAVNNFDDNVRRGAAQWNDDQLRRILHTRAWRSDRLRTCKPKPLLDHGPLIAIKVRLITRKSLGGIQTDLSSRALDRNGEPIDGLFAIGEAAGFGGGGACGKRSLEGTFLSGCILTARAAAESL